MISVTASVQSRLTNETAIWVPSTRRHNCHHSDVLRNRQGHKGHNGMLISLVHCSDPLAVISQCAAMSRAISPCPASRSPFHLEALKQPISFLITPILSGYVALYLLKCQIWPQECQRQDWHCEPIVSHFSTSLWKPTSPLERDQPQRKGVNVLP